ncbi:hypothetical protein M407DRAFT_242901 [Tulasnella calospora MUT 4182]|uniref:MARVEL domain-containing protein n=1 Tax=Tulasnella calospora MUT 4182 TaxID=1051891 RepID=A0A0C3QNJ4_9AGAM|nr:hypothetical protein M407DRAFT_242901 [Tulasnella calospora MUT 4182]
MVQIHFPFVRVVLYATWAVFAFLLFCLCCARINYTDHSRDEKSLFNGEPFYDPSIVELLISSIFALIWIPVVLILIRKRSTHPIFARQWFELIVLSVLWMFWVGGAGAASTVWPSLSWCHHPQCRLLEAIMAFAWLGWIINTVLLFGSIIFAAKNRAWKDDLYDTWNWSKN